MPPPPRPRLLRPLKSRVDASVRDAMDANAAKWAGEMIGKAISDSLETVVYDIDLQLSVRIFARLELGGKFSENKTSDEYQAIHQFLTDGCARFFIAEKASFASKLKQNGFASPMLTSVTLDVVHDSVAARKPTNPPPQVESHSVHLTRSSKFFEEESGSPGPASRRFS